MIIYKRCPITHGYDLHSKPTTDTFNNGELQWSRQDVQKDTDILELLQGPFNWASSDCKMKLILG